MNRNITISQEDDNGRKKRFEFWFHENFIVIHVHGFTDDEKFAKHALKNRMIWGCWYFCFESFIPRFVFEKIVSTEECVDLFVEWYQEEEPK